MLLTAAIFLPVLGAALLGLIPRSQEKALKAAALLITLATAVVGRRRSPWASTSATPAGCSSRPTSSGSR